MEVLRRVKAYNERGREISARVIKCYCGREVICSRFTNTCECGKEYNFAGQALAPRSQWEEDWEEETE